MLACLNISIASADVCDMIVVDAYRNKMRSTMIAGGQDVSTAPHFETRPGKRKWQERMGGRRERRVGSATL